MNLKSRLTRKISLTWVKTVGIFACAAMLSACALTKHPAPGLAKIEKVQAPKLEPGEKAHVFYFLQAELNRQKGDVDQALVYMNKAIEADPESMFLKMELAKLLVYKNDIPEALTLIRKGLEDHPENIDFLTVLAQIKLMQNNEAEVPIIFEKILSINPKDQAVYFLLGGLYSKMNQTPKAIDTFKRLTVQFPESFSGHYYLGKLHMVEENYSEAKKELNEAYRLNSDLVEALYGLIQIYEIQKNNKPLPGLYAQILDKDPEDARASLALALIYHTTKKEKKALGILAKLGERSTNESDILRYVVRYYIKKTLYPESIYLLENMLKTAASKGDIYYFLGLCQEESKNTQAAVEAFEHVPFESKYFEKSVLITAFHYMDMKKNDKAIALLEQALVDRPENIEFILYLGSFYEEEEMYQKALDMYLKGLSIDQNSTKLYFRLGVVYDKKGDRISCIEEMKKVLKIDPDDANALNYLGYTYADLGMNLEEAEELITKALSFKPDDGYITDSLGWVYYQKGNYEKAVATLEKAVGMIPDDPILLEHLGDAFFKTSDTEKALEFYQRSLKNKKKGHDALKLKIDRLMNKQTSLNP
ncbi:MAG: tetratricopeptide repeat protein [Proteobacteria bacterium]|nr:tetratricopeptide repeat protein [Pseudomonadota bacterium]